MRVAFIGLGAIGRGVLRLLGPADGIDVVGALVASPGKVRAPGAPPLFASVADLLATQPEVVVEAAGHAPLARLAPAVLRAGIDVIAVSVGALANRDVEVALMEAAIAGRSRLIVASGAIGALDAIAAAGACGGLQRVIHTTRKPPGTLLDPQTAAALAEPRQLFSGTAREGALLFPESINVAAAVSLAGLGLDRTEVCVIADPAVTRNTHEVLAHGDFGDLRFEIRNIPTHDNPRTGKLVAMSIVHALRKRHAALVVG